jgi:hypothetical protein
MIDVRLRLFIPSRAVAIPIGPLGDAGFDGDNRGFSYDQGTSRADIWIDVDNSPIATRPINLKRMEFGQTRRYDKTKIVDVAGKPFWWKEIRRNPFLNTEDVPDAIATAEVNAETMRVTGTIEQGAFGIIPNIRVKLHTQGKNPLEPLAPPFNCDLDVLISATGTPLISYSISGAHDGFPAYELYISQRPVYFFDPVTQNTNPLNLFIQNIIINIPPTVLI